MPQLEISFTLQATIEDAYDFLIRPDKVVDISNPEIGISIVSGPEVLTEGSRVEFEVTGYGIPQKLLHEFTNFREPFQFLESQIEGPLRRMQHEHLFESSDGGIIIIDRIEFEPPGGMMGMLLNEERIAKALQSGFNYRNQELKRLLESS